MTWERGRGGDSLVHSAQLWTTAAALLWKMNVQRRTGELVMARSTCENARGPLQYERLLADKVWSGVSIRPEAGRRGARLVVRYEADVSLQFMLDRLGGIHQPTMKT